ncbi:GumC family protein [Pollutibacter soli]|uniref:GumC family protein n=1 Tax=Pollutibacter soli TaxID=3034157 RepID=UPI003013AD84
MKKEPQNNDSNPGQLQQVIYKYVPYWPVFVILFVLTGLYTAWYLYSTTPGYAVTASIKINDEKKGQEYSKAEQMLNSFTSKYVVENEIEIIGSIPVLTRVVKELNLCAPVFQQSGWRGAKVSSGYQSSPIEVQVKNTRRVSAPKINKIYFTYDEKNQTVDIAGKSYPIDQWVKTPYDTLKFVKNPRYYPAPQTKEKTEEPKYFFALFNEEAMAKILKGTFSASAINKQATIITLRLGDTNPERGKAIMDAIVSAYHNLSQDKSNEIAHNTLAWLDKRIENVSRELDSLETGIKNFRSKTGTIDIGEQGRMYLSGAQQTDQQYNTYQLQLFALEEVDSYIKSKDANGNIGASMINSSDPVLRDLLEKLSLAETRYEQLRPTTGENSPAMISIREEIAKLKPRIAENIQNQRRIINGQMSQLKQKNNEYASRLSTIPANERELIEVSRAQQTKNDVYSYLLARKEEISYQLNTANYINLFVDYPTSSNGPVSPNINLMMLMSLVLPIGLGIGLISLKDLASSKVLYRADVEKLTSYPFAGEIIYEKIDYTRSRSFAQEQFRHLRNSLKYYSEPEVPLKRVLVTSSIMGEGKSFVSVNLAKSYARSGKKVALLELDLYRPKLREFFGMEELPGISDYLAGQANENEIIFPISDSPGLFLVPSGTIQEDASEYLVGPNFEIFLNYLDTKFDVLIIDSAPVKAISDAYVIAHFVQLTLFVIRHKHTPKSIIGNMDHEIESHNMKNVALVFNGIKGRGFGKFSFGYGHGYGYDYKNTYEEYNRKKKSR